jgi:hypothetical protein
VLESRAKGLTEVKMTDWRHVLVLEVDSKYNTVFVDLDIFLLHMHSCIILLRFFYDSDLPSLTLHTTYTYSTSLRQGSFVACLEFLQPIRHLTPLLPRFHFTKHNNPPSPSRNNRIAQSNNRTKSSNSTSIPPQQCTQSRKRYHQSK